MPRPDCHRRATRYVTGNLPIEYPDVNVSLANIGRAMGAAENHGVPVVTVQNFAPATAPIFACGRRARNCTKR